MQIADYFKFKCTSIILRTFTRSACLLALSLCLAACASIGQGTSKDINKPVTDQRVYNYLELKNGLKVLLVSDPAAKQAAASMNVGVGSGHDPQERQGLAHFLEHMLFLGTEKYPEAGEYQGFISTYGGNNNAYTAYENTNYFFDIDEMYLEQALDRFAQFFIAPKFDADFLEREKKAVDSEFHLSFKDDGRRSLDAIKSVINPAHPFSKFSTGNALTLADRQAGDIRKELIDFYEKYYYATNMSLVVYGQQSPAELKAMVVDKFSAIPSTAIQELTANDEPQSNDEPLFLEDSLPAKLYVQSIKDINTLSLMFPVPDDSENYKINPYYFIAHLIGYEGKGSLLSELKRLGWAESLSAGGGISFNNGSLFPVNISLTPEGRKHIDDITHLFFKMIAEIKDAGLTADLYNEQTQMARISFNYRETGRPYEYVSSLSSNLQHYAPDDVLFGPYMMEKFDEKTLQDMLSYINPNNLFVMVMAKDVPVELHTSWYKAPYSFEAIDSKLIKQWQQVGLDEQLAAPKKNPYLVNNFDLVQHKDSGGQAKKIKETKNITVWQLAENLNALPKATVYLRFKTHVASLDKKNAVLNGLYASLINDVLNEEAYDAYLTGLSLYFSSHMRGINMQVKGFNDKQLQLIESALKTIKLPVIDNQRFNSIKHDYQLALRNSQLEKPYMRVYDLFQTMMQTPHFSDTDLEMALATVTVKDLENYINEFWQNTAVEMFVNGNINKKQALLIAKLVTEHSNNKDGKAVKIGLVKLPEEEKSQLWSIYTQQNDHAYLRYIQGQNTSIEERAYFLLSGQMLRALFYYQLRTEQQLGYLVNASYFSNLGVPGLSFIIQSNKVPAPVLDKAVDLFLDHANERFINTMKLDEFTKNKAAVRAQLLTPPSSLVEQSEYYWARLAAAEEFDMNEQLAAAVEAISFEDWKQFFAQRFAKGQAQRTLRFSTQHQPINDEQNKAIIDWKSQQDVYWLPRADEAEKAAQ